MSLDDERGGSQWQKGDGRNTNGWKKMERVRMGDMSDGGEEHKRDG